MTKNRLKELRENKDWTQEQLSLISNVSRATISTLFLLFNSFILSQ